MAELNLRAAAKQSWDTIFAQAYPKLADMIRSINEEMDRTLQDSKREIRSVTLSIDRLDERLVTTKTSINSLILSQEKINSYLSKIDLSPSEDAAPNIDKQILQSITKQKSVKGGMGTAGKVGAGLALGAAGGAYAASRESSGGDLSALSSADNIKFIADKILFNSSKIVNGSGESSGGNTGGGTSGGSSGSSESSGQGPSGGQSGSSGGGLGSTMGGTTGSRGEASGGVSGSSGTGGQRAVDSGGGGTSGGSSFLVPGRNSRVAATNMRFDATRVGGVGGSSSQGEYYNNMYNAVYEAAKASGLPYPEVIASLGASQTSLETGYGKHMVGNNAFGIKGTGSAGTVNANTQEFVGGKMVGMKQGFRAYGDVTESANDYVNMMIKNQKRYSGVLTAKTVEEAIAAQAKSGYATDPSYGSKLASINSRFGGQNAAKPETKLAKSGPAINNASIDNKVGNEKLQQTASSSQVNNLITQSPSSQTPNQEPPKSGNEVDVRNRLGRLIAQT